jgi:hypothetical protein
MIETPLPSPLVRIEGAAEVLPVDGGVRPSRLPAAALRRAPAPSFALVAAATAGIRLRLRTAAIALELATGLTRAAVPGVGTLPAVFDLFADGDRVARVPAEGGAVIALDALTSGGDDDARQVIRFAGLAPREKDLEIWLPHTALCDVHSVRADAPLVEPPPSTVPRWIHYGSSISHCIEAEGPSDTWPAVAARATGLDHLNLGFAGNAMLDPFVARAIRDRPADVISLKIGANIVEQATMRVRTFLPAVHGFLDTIREAHPDTPVIVVSPIISPVMEEFGGPVVYDGGVTRTLGTRLDLEHGALNLRIVRELLADLVAGRVAEGEALTYVDGRELLGEPEDLHDGIHPSAPAYLRMGARFAKVLAGQGFDQSA